MHPSLTDPVSIKLTLASLVMSATVVADESLQPAGWENIGIKALLIAAVVYLVRELSKQRAEDKANSTAREEKMVTALDKVSDALGELKSETKTQTEYYKAVARTIIDRELASPCDTTPARPPTSPSQTS